MATKRIWLVVAATATLAGGIVRTAAASEEGRRNTTIGLALATAYSYKRYDDSIKSRHARERAAAEPRWHAHHDRGHHYGWYKHHKHHH